MSKLVGFGKFAGLPEEQVGPAGAQAENVQSAIKRVISLSTQVPDQVALAKLRAAGKLQPILVPL
jgi:hypothetical protein